MAHLPPNTAIFSPSVARAAASAAKDWSYIDSWLTSHFHALHRSPPAFERTPETLRALLALATANEAADDSRATLARLESKALADLQAHQQQQPTTPADDARLAILASLEENLSREGTVALDTMAALAVDSGLAFPTPVDVGRRLASLPGQLAELEQTEARIQVLARYLESETKKLQVLAAEVRKDEGYRPANDLAKQNLEAQRHIRNLTARLPELRDRVTGLAKSVGVPSPTMEQVRREEEAYLALLAEKTELDAQVKAFQGLPHNLDMARQELEHLRDELRRITERRDAVFEGLVERETPRKPTRRP